MSVSGKFVNVLSGNTTLIGGIYSARFRDTVEALPKDSAASGGYGDRDAGLKDCTVNFSGWIDVGGGTYTAIEAGDLVANLSTPVNANGSLKLLDMPVGLVTSFEAGGEVRGRLEFSAEVQNKGSYTVNVV